MIKLNRILLIPLLATCLVTAGCFTFHKKDPNISAKVEAHFMDMWVEVRANELVAEGTPPAQAKRQAVSEFRERFKYTNAANQ